jgi:hypothetical protein
VRYSTALFFNLGSRWMGGQRHVPAAPPPPPRENPGTHCKGGRILYTLYQNLQWSTLYIKVWMIYALHKRLHVLQFTQNLLISSLYQMLLRRCYRETWDWRPYGWRAVRKTKFIDQLKDKTEDFIDTNLKKQNWILCRGFVWLRT